MNIKSINKTKCFWGGPLEGTKGQNLFAFMIYTNSMKLVRNISLFYRRLKALAVARYEASFQDSRTTRLMNVLGATTIVVGGLKKNGRAFTLTLWKGSLLRSENFRLEYLDGKPVLTNDLKLALTFEDDDHVRDIVLETQRDEWFAEHGYTVRFIRPDLLDKNPAGVGMAIRRFIYG